MQYDLVVLGDLVADLIVPIERLPIYPLAHGWAEGIFVEPGGAGNVLVAARRMDLATVTLGAVGDDSYGQEMLAMLAREGVIIEHVAICPERKTVLCMVLADQAGQHVYLGIKDAIGYWPLSPNWERVVCSARALFTDGYTVRDVYSAADLIMVLQCARAAHVPVYFDPGPSVEFIPPELVRQVVAASDVLLLTEEEIPLTSGIPDRVSGMQALLALGPSLLVVKQGAGGCSIVTSAGTEHIPGFQVDVVDTVGAGDSFAAAFIAGRLRGGSLQQAATLANAMGAMTATQRGAGTRIPERAGLLTLLQQHPDVQALVRP